eukprot:scaffold116225_cov19-Tisochrysis_lutea.AAC.2
MSQSEKKLALLSVIWPRTSAMRSECFTVLLAQGPNCGRVQQSAAMLTRQDWIESREAQSPVSKAKGWQQGEEPTTLWRCSNTFWKWLFQDAATK